MVTKVVRIAMSCKEIERVGIVKRILAKELTQAEASEQLHISIRQVKRLVRSFRKEGEQGLVSKRKGGNRRFSEELKATAIDLIKANYADFKPTFASEKLAERDGIWVNRETLRQWMQAEGIWKGRKRKKARIHQSRERRSCLGELIQIDGSPHDWFEGRGPKCCLLVFIDDATSRLMHLRFESSETTVGYFSAIESYVLTYGCPLVFYSDKDSIFVVNGPDKIDGLKGQTQFQRAMGELGIHIIHANSPQAKGRVERANSTLQDRLIKEMRLRGISDIETANRYLPEFIEQHNERFACPALDLKDAHKPLKVGHERLKLILSQQDTRKLSKNLEFSYENMIYKVLRPGQGYSFRHAQVIVCKQTNGEIAVLKDNVPLKYEMLGKARYGKLIAESKQVNLIVDSLIKEEEKFEKQEFLLANISSFPTYPQAPQPQMGAL